MKAIAHGLQWLRNFSGRRVLPGCGRRLYDCKGIRRRLMLSVLLLAPLPFHASNAQVSSPPPIADWQVKAAYLYKFGSYVEWPEHTFPGPESPLTIGVFGADPLADALVKIVANHTVNGRSVTVRRVQSPDTLAGLNVLFVGGTNKEQTAEMLAAAKSQPILVVTEVEQGLALGSMINFLLVDGRVRFEASPKAARQSNLVISARLLQVAYRVMSELS
jgi:hypothetical protein